jgi:preprotein translocase subunit SecB
MYPSPLILERHFFTRVEVNSHVDGDPTVINMLNFHTELSQAVDRKKLFQLLLKLRIYSPEGKKTTYSGEIEAVGIFSVVDNFPDDKTGKLVECYGASLLFAAIRELVLNLTSRGPWPPLLLKAFSFIKPTETETAPAPLEEVAKC